jgi:hypothetical protein
MSFILVNPEGLVLAVFISSSSPLLPTLCLRTVAVLIRGSIVVFAVLPTWNGVFKSRQEKSESQNETYLINIEHKFMIYNNNSKNNNDSDCDYE